MMINLCDQVKEKSALRSLKHTHKILSNVMNENGYRTLLFPSHRGIISMVQILESGVRQFMSLCVLSFFKKYPLK